MRRCVTHILTSLSLLLVSPLLRAEATENTVDQGDANALGEEGPLLLDGPQEGIVAGHHYNRWSCYAVPRARPFQRIWGYSHWFPAGSGQGQQAHVVAYRQALAKCQQIALWHRCVSNFQNNCAVQRR